MKPNASVSVCALRAVHGPGPPRPPAARSPRRGAGYPGRHPGPPGQVDDRDHAAVLDVRAARGARPNTRLRSRAGTRVGGRKRQARTGPAAAAGPEVGRPSHRAAGRAAARRPYRAAVGQHRHQDQRLPPGSGPRTGCARHGRQEASDRAKNRVGPRWPRARRGTSRRPAGPSSHRLGHPPESKPTAPGFERPGDLLGPLVDRAGQRVLPGELGEAQARPGTDRRTRPGQVQMNAGPPEPKPKKEQLEHPGHDRDVAEPRGERRRTARGERSSSCLYSRNLASSSVVRTRRGHGARPPSRRSDDIHCETDRTPQVEGPPAACRPARRRHRGQVRDHPLRFWAGFAVAVIVSASTWAGLQPGRPWRRLTAEARFSAAPRRPGALYMDQWVKQRPAGPSCRRTQPRQLRAPRDCPDGMLGTRPGPSMRAHLQCAGPAALGLILLIATAGSVLVTAFVGPPDPAPGRARPCSPWPGRSPRAGGTPGYAVAPGLWLVLSVSVLLGCLGRHDGRRAQTPPSP